MKAALAIPATGWRLPDTACELLARLVAEHEPALIVECGSGRSTVALAEALRTIGNGTVIALEHDWDYWAETSEWIEERDLFTNAQVRHAPLEGGWYALSSLVGIDGIGMLVVDGPPGHIAPLARKPALPLLRDRLKPGCVVLLDDVNREPERTIWRDWGIAGTTLEHAKGALVYGTLR